MNGLRDFERRVAQLASSQARWTATERDTQLWMTLPSLVAVLQEASADKARRRWLYRHGHVAGRPMSPAGGWYITTGDGWYRDTDDDERDQLERAEFAEALALLAAYGLSALEGWADEADDRDWPSLHGTPAGWREFRQRLHRHRDMMRVHRDGANAWAAEWRRQYPAWRPDMTEGDYDDWELAMLTAAGVG